MRNQSRLILFSLIAFLLTPTSLFAAPSRNLYPLFYGKAVKVYVAEVKDSTKDHEISPEAIKLKIEEALKNRKSITFEITQNPEEAKLLIETDVKEFMWTDHDPIDMLMGVGSAAADAAMVEDYARLQADMSVADAKSKKELWKERVMATITKKPMSREASIPLAGEELAKVFIKDCFSKRRS